jgi:hypothetical protein
MAARSASVADGKETISPPPSHFTSAPPWAPAASARRSWWARERPWVSSSPDSGSTSARSLKRMVTRLT